MISKGTDIKNVLIHLIATSKDPITRTDLARITGLSKMTVSNHISELIDMRIIAEKPMDIVYDRSIGRKPVPVSISPDSPCICGILIKRTFCQSIIADISGKIIDSVKTDFSNTVTRREFIDTLLAQFDMLASRSRRRIIGCGISCLGPVNKNSGYILNPPNFFGLSNIPIVSILQAHTGLPTFLIHDADAGALVEKLYGNGSDFENFFYLHIDSGIGFGFVLNGQLFSGASGQSGEIGHVSINFNGPPCNCGNVGCLEMYAGLPQIQKRISDLLPHYKQSPFHKIPSPEWRDIIDLASAEDPIAITAMDEFCGYLSHALFNAIKLLDFSTIIIGYHSSAGNHIIEDYIYPKLRRLTPPETELKIIHSFFNGDAPLIGSVAVVANQIFDQKISLIQ